MITSGEKDKIGSWREDTVEFHSTCDYIPNNKSMKQIWGNINIC